MTGMIFAKQAPKKV